jgi:hypothetical protein
MTVAILGVVTVGFLKMYQQGATIWNYGTARLALANDARMTMAALTNFIQACNGTSIKISRYDTNQPANSYIAAYLVETAYATTTQNNCCGGGSGTATFGEPGDYVQFYEYGNYLLVVTPYLLPGTNLTSRKNVSDNTRYNCMTISANVDSIMFTFTNSPQNQVVDIAARFSKVAMQANKPPIKILLTKEVVIKHLNSAGFYAN